MERFCKSDIEFHRDGGRELHAAVNVKLYRWEWPDPARVAEDHGADAEEAAAFAAHWREEIEDSETAQRLAELETESGWDWLSEYARDIYGPRSSVFPEGRRGGWAVVAPDGWNPFTREDVAEWDAIAVARWGRFVKACRLTCDDIPYQAVASYFVNVWEPEREAERLHAEAEAATLESIRRFSFYYDTPGVAA